MLSFLGIGAQKAGTTWLYKMLSCHPELWFPLGKEAHFWNSAHTQDREQVRRYFGVFGGGPEKGGEITPAYAMLEPGRVRQIASWQPRLKLLFLIRNPIDRAWSAACMALARAEMTVNEASDAWFIDHFRSRGSLARGDYLSTLRIWHQVFGTERLHLLRYEDIQARPRALLTGVAEFLGVDPEGFATFSDEALKRRVFQGRDASLRPALRAELEQLYRLRIQALEHYLGQATGW